MEVHVTGFVVAIVVLRSAKHNVSSGTAPIIYVDTEEEQQKVSMYMSRIFKAAVHDLENGVFILVKQY
ncbi:capping complex subunit for YIEGIA [Caldanaerobacter sp.]|uniref:capping complex subunit for YIEGIA n=1 Tax=Caldanaerobacter sp. TaxID=2930036 RepID=UPI003C73864C